MQSSRLDQLPHPPQNQTGWPWTEESEILPNQMPDGSPWPKISIVTPSYNQGDFLEATIRSVLLQGYPNLEYIIIDGNSTDKSVEIIQKYSSWLTFWSSEPDDGQADAINKGFQHATGEICAYLNSDDLYLPGAFCEVALSYKKHSWQWAYSKTKVGETLENSNRIWDCAHPSLPFFIAQQQFSQQGCFWKADVLETPYFRTKWRYLLDADFFIRIFLVHGQPKKIDYITSFFRTHENSKTSTLETLLQKEAKALHEELLPKLSSDLAIKVKKEIQAKQCRLEASKLNFYSASNFLGKINEIKLSFKLLFKTPYPLKNRLFISLTLKKVLSLFQVKSN
jgi:glycosyltransferase involved in cell wall biosynthesis